MYVMLSNIECICLTDAVGYVFYFTKILYELCNFARCHATRIFFHS